MLLRRSTDPATDGLTEQHKRFGFFHTFSAFPGQPPSSSFLSSIRRGCAPRSLIEVAGRQAESCALRRPAIMLARSTNPVRAWF